MRENKQVNHSPPAPAFRSGFACLAGRPNVGKSTLTNALVGAKVAITSDRPQTTRRVIRGIVHRPDAQLILVDTPGLHKPRTLLGERLDSLVRNTLAEVDVIGFCVPATDPVGPGDRFFARELENVKKTPVVVVVTKCDQVPPERVAEQLLAVSGLGDWADVVPVSAVTGYQLDVLADVLVSHLPAGVALYPDGELTDEPEQIMVAELIREAALDGVRDELPHSIAVVVEEMGPRPGRDDLTDVHAELYVERPTQKAIVIGAGGVRLKEVGTRARHQIEALLGTKVYLPAREDRQGLAAQPPAAPPPGLLRLTRLSLRLDLRGPQLPGPLRLADHVVAERLVDPDHVPVGLGVAGQDVPDPRLRAGQQVQHGHFEP